MSLSSVAVVILNWNGRSYLEKFLPTVILYSADAQIIVADNCSTDNSVVFLHDNFPSVEVIRLDKNYGFAQGYNEALKQVKAEIYVLLNSDVEVTPNWLTPCVDKLRSEETIAVCQPKIKAFHQKEYFEYAGAAGGYIDKYGYPFCRGRIFDDLEEDRGQYDSEKEIFWASGAAMFIKSTIFHQLQGFDGLFFAHMEEIDLCWRIQNKGKKIVVVPQSEVFHVGGGTLNRVKPFKTFLNFRNNLTMLYKNLPHKKRGRIIFVRLFLDGLAGIKFIMEGKFNHCFAIIKAHFAFYKYVLNASKNSATKAFPPTVYDKSILYHYFVKKQKKYSDLS